MCVRILGRPENCGSIDRKQLKLIGKEIRALLGYKSLDVGIKLASDNSIRRLNKQYRDINKATDVLSFPFFENTTPTEFAQSVRDSTPETGAGIGDIVIGTNYVYEQSKDQGNSLDDQLAVVLTHGMCHCVGYRHDTDEEWAEMQKKEEWILERLKAKFPIRTSTAPLSYVSPPTFQHNAEKKEEER